MTRDDVNRVAQGLANARPVFPEGPDYAAWFSAMAEIGCVLCKADPTFPYDQFKRTAVEAPRFYPHT